MSLSIRPVTKDNWYELIQLDVRDDQKSFVGSNLYSIAESKFGYDEPTLGNHWDVFPFGIYDGECPVGFFMYGYNFEYSEFQAFILRLMVDERYQGKGYGTFGMKEMLRIFRGEKHVRAVGISYKPENEVARKLYANLGFRETGEVLSSEIVAKLELRLAPDNDHVQTIPHTGK